MVWELHKLTIIDIAALSTGSSDGSRHLSVEISGEIERETGKHAGSSVDPTMKVNGRQADACSPRWQWRCHRHAWCARSGKSTKTAHPCSVATQRCVQRWGLFAATLQAHACRPLKIMLGEQGDDRAAASLTHGSFSLQNLKWGQRYAGLWTASQSS